MTITKAKQSEIRNSSCFYENSAKNILNKLTFERED